MKVWKEGDILYIHFKDGFHFPSVSNRLFPVMAKSTGKMRIVQGRKESAILKDLVGIFPCFNKEFKFGKQKVFVLALFGAKKGRWDVSNQSKALLDWLTKCGVYEDDSQATDLCVKKTDIDGADDLISTTIKVMPIYYLNALLNRSVS